MPVRSFLPSRPEAWRRALLVTCALAAALSGLVLFYVGAGGPHGDRMSKALVSLFVVGVLGTFVFGERQAAGQSRWLGRAYVVLTVAGLAALAWHFLA